ncbi:MAG TPA: PilZ domain-containing protein [Rhabdaerophilum sp.]|jgi:PilZ domain.|nr:PilZ domain-containing protein [Rhabdaerophilum sp.]
MPTENRSSTRVRSFLRGEIIHSNGASKTECIVRDLSDGGARIDAPSTVTVPEFFDLHIPLRGVVYRAQIIWRHGLELGLQFAKPKENEATVPDQKSSDVKFRMLELEGEVAKLRAQLAEMRRIVEHVVGDKMTG